MHTNPKNALMQARRMSLLQQAKRVQSVSVPCEMVWAHPNRQTAPNAVTVRLVIGFRLLSMERQMFYGWRAESFNGPVAAKCSMSLGIVHERFTLAAKPV